MEVKNTFYKTLDADWFIVVDIDEFIYHKDTKQILEQYKEKGITILQIQGYGMVSDKIPIDDGTQIYDQIKEGMHYTNYDKCAIFAPSVDINYDGGCHKCRPSGNVYYAEDCDIKLLHYKMLSLDYVIKKAKNVKLSSINQKKRWGIEGASPNMMVVEWRRHWNLKHKVIE